MLSPSNLLACEGCGWTSMRGGTGLLSIVVVGKSRNVLRSPRLERGPLSHDSLTHDHLILLLVVLDFLQFCNTMSDYGGGGDDDYDGGMNEWVLVA